MNTFVEVVEAGSFTAASERRGLSRAVVSKYVRQLEEHLGARLLNRTTRQLSLTEIGRLYYERCKSILAEIEAGRLRLVLPEYRIPNITINAIYPSRRHLSTKVRTFVDFLGGYFGEEPGWDEF